MFGRKGGKNPNFCISFLLMKGQCDARNRIIILMQPYINRLSLFQLIRPLNTRPKCIFGRGNATFNC